MSLKDWLDWGWIDRHPPNAVEIQDLLEVVERDLRDSQAGTVSEDWLFSIAYNAALQSAAAALAAEGFRAKGEGKHRNLIDSLLFTIKADDKLLRKLQAFRAKRHVGAYETAGSVSKTELREMVALANDLAGRVKKWLNANHPELLKNRLAT